MNRAGSFALALTLALVSIRATHAQQIIDDKTPASHTQRIVLVGDSTMNHSNGWGGGFCDDLAGDMECFNMARNGRSSKSYRTEGFWTRALQLKPNYMLIGFGGNDLPGKGPDRETDPKTTFYANMTAYVTEAKAAGIKPVLITPMETRNMSKEGKLPRVYDAYAEAIRKVAADTGTPLIDLYAKTLDAFATRTQAQLDELNHIDPTRPEAIDRAHINRKGAALIGGFVAEGLASTVPVLAKSIHVQQ